MIFAENNMPVVAEGFSGVVTSVDKLEYYFIFYAIGTGVDTELSIKTALTRISNFDLINGLEHMKPYDTQIQVVNISHAVPCREWDWGWFQSGWDECDYYGVLHTLMKEMKEVTFVVSAGNKSEQTDNMSVNIDANIYKTRNTPDSYRVIPAEFANHLENVITVGGVDVESGNRHDHSNYGSAVVLGAPYTVWGVNLDEFSTGGVVDGYDYLNGTSYSAPLVTGTVALMKALNPDLTPLKIRTILRDTGWENAVRPENWPTLDAGAAVDYVLGVNGKLDGTVSLRTVRGSTETSLSEKDSFVATINAQNTGKTDWTFAVYGTLTPISNPGTILHSHMPEKVISRCRYEGCVPGSFDIAFEASEGSWQLSIYLYRADDLSRHLDCMTPTLDCKTLTVEIPGATPTPAPTNTPPPSPTPVPTDTAAAGSCVPPSSPPSGLSDSSGIMIEIEQFPQPPNKGLIYNVYNSTTSWKDFDLTYESLSHPNLVKFGMLLTGLRIPPGGVERVVSHPADFDWNNFDYSCELEIAIYVRPGIPASGGFVPDRLLHYDIFRTKLTASDSWEPTPTLGPLSSMTPTPAEGNLIIRLYNCIHQDYRSGPVQSNQFAPGQSNQFGPNNFEFLPIPFIVSQDPLDFDTFMEQYVVFFRKDPDAARVKTLIDLKVQQICGSR